MYKNGIRAQKEKKQNASNCSSENRKPGVWQEGEKELFLVN